MYYFKKSIPLLVLALAACNENEAVNNADEAQITQQNLFALNALTAVEPNKTTFIDLQPFIIKNNRNYVEITHFDNLNSELCPVIAPANLGFEISTDILGRCDYRYHVTNTANERDSAILSVLSTNNANAMLPLISLTAKTDARQISVGLDEHILGLEQLEFDEIISIEFIPISFGVDASDEYEFNYQIINKREFQLQYAKPQSTGWFYIQYSLKQENQASSTVEKVGSLFINITDNEAPQITKPRYLYRTVLKPNRLATLDLEALGIVTHTAEIEEENASWQLVSVHVANAYAEPTEPENIFNKSFDFLALTNGYYDISYGVSDHEDGFAFGMLRIIVDDAELTNPWQDISIDYCYDDCDEDEDEDEDEDDEDIRTITFTHPLLAFEALDYATVNNIDWEYNIIMEELDYRYYNTSLWTATLAKKYCASQNKRLPTPEEIKALKEKLPSDTHTTWPHAMNYITEDSEGFFEAEIVEDGAIPRGNLNEHSLRYMTCVSG